MKKMITAIVLMAAMVYGVSAQSTKRIILTQDTSANNIVAIDPTDEDAVEYTSINLSAPDIKHITSCLPAEIALVEGEEGSITISYPTVEEEYVKFDTQRVGTHQGYYCGIKHLKDTLPRNRLGAKHRARQVCLIVGDYSFGRGRHQRREHHSRQEHQYSEFWHYDPTS